MLVVQPTSEVADPAPRLTVREYEVFRVLREAMPGHVTAGQLAFAASGVSDPAALAALRFHIKRIRDKLGAQADAVVTLRGLGYRLAYDVTVDRKEWVRA